MKTMRQPARAVRRWDDATVRARLLCGVLGVAVPVATAHAETALPLPSAVPQPQASGGSPDPWTSPDAPAAYPQGGYAPVAPGANPAPGAPPGAFPPGYAPPEGGFIRVDMRADAPGVRLDRVVGPGATVPVCLAPCSRVVARNNLYVIQGDGVRTTSQFLLPDDRPDVTLTVHAGSTGRQAGGAVLMAGGVVAAYVGLLTVEIGLASGALADGTGGSGTRSDRTATIGAGILGVGLAAAIGGIYLVMTSSTKVNSSTGSTFTKSERSPARPRSAVALTARGLEF